MAEKRTTLADVARRAGLSPTAASMILNGRPDTRLSEEAHRRVHEAASELGYRPNIAARSLRTSKSATLGFISDSVATTRFASGLILGALEAAEAAEHVVFVLETGGDPGRESQAVRAMLDRQVDGIVLASMRAHEIIAPKIPRDVPVVMLNASSSLYPDAVLPDEEAGGRDAVQLLVDSGHGDSVVLLGQNDEVEKDLFRSTTVARRIRGIRAAMVEHGYGFVEEISSWDWEPTNGYDETRALLQRRSDVGAILCMNDRLAFGAYQAISEAGLSVPGDISLVSFDNDEIAEYLRPGLTTIALPHTDMGRTAVKILLAGEHPGEVLVPMPVIRRGSLGRSQQH